MMCSSDGVLFCNCSSHVQSVLSESSNATCRKRHFCGNHGMQIFIPLFISPLILSFFLSSHSLSLTVFLSLLSLSLSFYFSSLTLSLFFSPGLSWCETLGGVSLSVRHSADHLDAIWYSAQPNYWNLWNCKPRLKCTGKGHFGAFFFGMNEK